MQKLLNFAALILFSSLLILSCGGEKFPVPEEIASRLPEKVDYNFHVKPILSDRCYTCHGPDENTRKANLRLDIEQEAFAKLSQTSSEYSHAIKKGNASKSEMIARVYHNDPELKMPPPESKLELTEYEKALLQKWIDQGAEWKPHWSFIPPKKSELAHVSNSNWPKNPIDHFILSKLEKEGLAVSPAADKERLLRRVYFDLTGLPPGVEEMDAFLADEDKNALEKVIDRLLASDACAERMTLEWLDVARYADSHGLHADGWRNMWPWRDWVIEAFKENLPYDEFITQQLAGDLLPDPNPKKILATAFNRNHPMTGEGGVVDEEFRLEYVFDRTSTVATAFMGLTVGCARCHDHKFDPVSQKEFYELASFFNNVKELGMTGDDGNYGPMLMLPDEDTQMKLDNIKKLIEEKQVQLNAVELEQTAAFIVKLKNEANQIPFTKHHYPLDRISETQSNGKTIKIADGFKSTYVNGDLPIVDGKFGKGFKFGNDYQNLYLDDVAQIDVADQLTVGAWINTSKATANETQTIIGNSGEKNNFWRGWDVYIDSTSRLSARLIHSLPHNYIQITSKEKVEIDKWHHVAFSYDGSSKAKGMKLYLDGKLCDSQINFDNLYKNIRTLSPQHKEDKRALLAGKAGRHYTGESGVFDGIIDEIKIFDRRLSHLEIRKLAKPKIVAQQLKSDPSRLDRTLLEDHYFWTMDESAKQTRIELQELIAEQIRLQDEVEEIMVIQEMKNPRPMFLLDRGNYANPTEPVSYGTPRAVLSFPEELPKNRLGLAQWLTNENNPLTARVTVNRYWQMIFGRGLVETPQDFGIQGALPSHPALLDYLAVVFMESGWDVRALLKLILTSATYQQSSVATTELKEKDPYNILLGRGPSHRLQAEMIRDNALAASGLLVRKIGGPSVRPYQPDGLWIDKGNFSNKLLRYRPTMGDSLYRRSMYTFVKRTSPHPAMVAFDAPDRSVCIVKRENTNTPLQALVLMNDPQFMEAAKALAIRVQKEANGSIEDQTSLAFRLLTGRKATADELTVFSDLFNWQVEKFSTDTKAINEILSVGQLEIEKNFKNKNTAALTAVISTMISHDEFYTKR